jgi:hypothetical protein
MMELEIAVMRATNGSQEPGQMALKKGSIFYGTEKFPDCDLSSIHM